MQPTECNLETTTDNALPPARALVAALVAIVALATAGMGEHLLRSEAPMWQPLLLYALAAIALAATAAPFTLAPPARNRPGNEALLWRLLALGAIGALALAAVTFATLYANLRAQEGLWLWLVTIALLLLTGIAAWRYETPSSRWSGALPNRRSGRVAFALALLLILAVGIAARTLWLDQIPLGINPDEGDRTATAMQVLRGTTPQTLFEAGWYRISMMYFYLLAGWLKLLGIGYVQARLFTALWGVVTLGAIMWMGARNWNWRVALMAGATYALTGFALQFARETSEAGPTAALWALSITLLLEGARRGRALAWIGAGLAGGFSLYFYPSGRIWALLALLLGIVWLLRWSAARDGAWPRLLRGLALAAVASLAICAPFFAQMALFPHEFALRFAETSVLRPENAARLHYVDPTWQTPRLLAEQIARALGIFARYGDGAGFWPTDEPLTGPVLALLLLLGLGYSTLRARDPRAAALALWASVGMSGMVLTVETPNLQRMATALPPLFLGVAVLVDDLLQRIINLAAAPLSRRSLHWVALPATTLLLLAALAADTRFYFVDYAQMNRWEGWNQEGYALTLLPDNTLHLSLGNSFHMVNSGWVRLLAPDAMRAGVRSPGTLFPLPEAGNRDLAFLLYPNQRAYLPWLLSLYPAAAPVNYLRANESHYFDLLHVPAAEVAATRGAWVNVGDQRAHVATLGEPPPFATADDVVATWSATLRVPQQWNYVFRLEGAPAMLSLNGTPILVRAEGEPNTTITLNLARGDHGITLTGSAKGTQFAWGPVSPGAEPQLVAPTLADLALSDGAPYGFAGRIEIEGLPVQMRQDNALATCCLGGMLDSRNRPLHATWSAILIAPRTGEYAFQLTLPGPGSLRVGDDAIVAVTDAAGGSGAGSTTLPAGEHLIVIEVSSQSGANGALELIWTPPGAEPSILPAAVLRPAAPLFGPPLAEDLLRTPDTWPVDNVLETVE
jgi:hypothetical protein